MKSKIIKIGLLVTVSLALLIWGVNYLKGKDLFKTENHFITTYDEVSGLSVSSLVFISGYKVGRVTSIKFAGFKSSKLIVDISIKSDVQIPKGSKIALYSADLLGSRALEVKFSDSNEVHIDGDTLASEISEDLMGQMSQEIQPIKRKAEKLMSSFDTLLTSVRMVLNKNTQDNLSKSFASIRGTFANLETTTYKLNRLITKEEVKISSILLNLDSISTNLKNNNAKIANILTNFSSLSDSIAASEIKSAINNSNKTLENINILITKINEGQGTMGKLVHDDTLFTSLKANSENLNNLLIDMKKNPRRYLHFSAIDRGKTIYLFNEEKRKEKKEEKGEKKHEKKKD